MQRSSCVARQGYRVGIYILGLSYASHCGLRVTLYSAASNWRRNPAVSKKKPYTVNGNAR
jgi:hypothetical protein